MKKNKFLYNLFTIGVVCSFLTFTGCNNGNLFGSLTSVGDSSDPDVILSDASNALANKNYQTALNLYNQILTADPNNSEALYGAAAAAVGSTGLNVATLVSNLTDQLNSSSVINTGVTDLASLISQSRESIHGQTTADPNSLLAGIDLEAVDAILDNVVCQLRKIIAGAADGTIQPNDIDVLLNLASLCLVRGVLRPIRQNFLDITTVNGEFIVVDKTPGGFAAFCASNQTFVQNIVADVVGAYQLFNEAANALNLGNNALVVKIRDDINTAIDLLLNSANTSTYLGAACETAIGISLANFQNNRDVFNSPGTCSLN